MPATQAARRAVRSLRRAARRHPEAVVVALAALAWAALFAADVLAPATGAAHAHGHGRSLAERVGAGSLSWSLMTLGMMAPAAVPAVRHVAFNSLRWRRRRAVAAFLASYLGVWVAFGIAAVTALALVWPEPAGGRARVLLAGLLAVAAAWHVAPARRRVLSGCRRTVPLPPRGWRADAACMRFGTRFGASCVGSCWALMLPMAAVHTGHVLAGLALTAVIAGERLLRIGPRLRRPVAAGLVASAAVVLAAGGTIRP